MAKIRNVSIIGLGLIGGSLGMAIRNKGLAEKVIGIPRREETIGQAIKKEAIDEGTLDPVEGTQNADIIFVCTPINLIVSTIQKIQGKLKKGAIITDVGSSKGRIVEEIEKKIPAGVHFIGGHPMAGSDRFGIGAAHTFLFENANWILTPTVRTDKAALQKLTVFLKAVGAKVQDIAPDEHDLMVAGISHLPLMAAIALVRTVAEMKEHRDKMLELAATGFRDSTRIASGHPALARDMCATNKEMILKMIEKFKASLEHIEQLIKKGNLGDLESEFGRVKKLRDSIYSR